MSLEEEIKNLAIKEGVALVGICSAESIKDKEFSDPNYLLKGAQSIISIAVNMDDEIVRKYLSKEDYLSHCYEEGYLTKDLLRIGDKIKQFLEEKGYKAYRCDVNNNYRNIDTTSKAVIPAIKNLIALINKQKDPNIELTPKEEKTLITLSKMILPSLRKTPLNLIPQFSHRCAAVAAGLGRVGWSGNIVTEKYGARVLFNSIITEAVLIPDKSMKNNPCINCKLCEKACQGGLFAKNESQTIRIAHIEEKIAKRNSSAYCLAVCTGMVGQNKFKEWSTWSPFRFDDIDSLPLDNSVEDYVKNMFAKAVEKGGKEAENILREVEDTFLGLNNKPVEDFRPSCGFCQMVCGPTIQNKKESCKAIFNSGCIDKIFE